MLKNNIYIAVSFIFCIIFELKNGLIVQLKVVEI